MKSDGMQGAHFRLSPEPEHEPLGPEFKPLAPFWALWQQKKGGVKPTKTGQNAPRTGAKAPLSGLAVRQRTERGEKMECKKCAGGRGSRKPSKLRHRWTRINTDELQNDKRR